MSDGNKRKPYMFMCGVPSTHCSAGRINVNAALRGSGNRCAHGSPEEAFRCHRTYLISQGFEPIGSRELRAPDGSGIRVLTKPCRFGAQLRNGKAGTRNMSNVKIPGGGRRGGNVASY